MKIILLSQLNQYPLIFRLHHQGHVVMTTTADLKVAVRAIPQHRPHIVLVCAKADDSFARQAAEFISGLPGQRLVLHQPDDSDEILERQLAEIRKQVAAHKQSAVAEQRLILFDDFYRNLLHGHKLRTVEPEHETLIREQDKLLLILEQAVVQHEAARRYHEELKQWGRDEMREIGYRAMHGSCKSIDYAQEQIGRWLGVLARYIPGIDPDYLPTPGDAIRGMRWVFHGPSPETAYAFRCLSALGLNENLHQPLDLLLSFKFAAGEESVTQHAVLALVGCCRIVEEVADAHVSAIDRYLHVPSEKLLQDLHRRSVRREHQTVTEFWDLPLLREYPQLLVKTVEDFHRGRRSAAQVILPSFRDIVAARQTTEPKS